MDTTAHNDPVAAPKSAHPNMPLDGPGSVPLTAHVTTLVEMTPCSAVS
jgi:hypothetical protein